MISIEFISKNFFVITGQTMPRNSDYKYIVKNNEKLFYFVSYSTPDIFNDCLYTRGLLCGYDFTKLCITPTSITKKEFLENIDKLNSGNYVKIHK